jgi:hypothetical protein
MNILENGDYQLDDGTIIPKEQVGQQYKKLQEAPPSKEKEELQEGQCSGKMLLTD